MKDYSKRKGAYLGPTCKYGHDHGGGSWRSSNGTCFECADARISDWCKTEAGKKSVRATKERRKDASVIANKEYRQKNKDRIKEYNKRYTLDNKDWHLSYYRAHNAKKRASKIAATPSWSEADEIDNLYKSAHDMSIETGIKYEIDHIVPLISELVCGLHCISNLRIIERSANRSKGNRWWPDGPFESAEEGI